MKPLLAILLFVFIIMQSCSSHKTQSNTSFTEKEAEENALKVGSKAPDFTLANALGLNVSLNSLLEQGPVVLTWYRGGWCPHCNIALHNLQEYLPEFEAQNATLVAISPELPDNSLSTQQKNELEFEVLSDAGNQVGKQYQIIYKLSSTKAALYQAGVGLNKHNGDNSNELPIPATFIINPDGIIVWSYVNSDYKERADPQDIVRELQKLN